MTASELCVDCRDQASTVTIRHRCLCNACFTKYVSSKILKRMETYRLKNQTPRATKRLFLPLSGGVSSLVLLQVLDAQVQKQMRQQGRTAFEIVTCHVYLEHEDETWWDKVRRQFDVHTFLPAVRLGEVLKVDEEIADGLELLGLRRGEAESNEQFLSRIFASTKSATARADLQELLLKRLIICMAKLEKCDGLTWGHSDSKLAAQALSSVAKGRGGGVPNELADGPSAWGVSFNYPLRDLFKAELKTYLGILPEEIRMCCVEDKKDDAPVTLRNTSISELMSTYITGQGEKYPSIMANVVRTAGKLQVPNVNEGRRCKLCAMPVNANEQLCLGCERMKQDIKV